MEVLMDKEKKSFHPGYSFGLRKALVKKNATKEEVQRAINLINTMREHSFQLTFHRPSAETGNSRKADIDFQRKHRKLRYIASAELRGLRKLWRCRHTDSFSTGLYYLTSTLRPWQISIPVGKCGSHNWGPSRSPLPPNTLLVWVGRDELSANEFMVSDTNFLIKVPRGHTTGDKILKVKEQQC